MRKRPWQILAEARFPWEKFPPRDTGVHGQKLPQKRDPRAPSGLNRTTGTKSTERQPDPGRRPEITDLYPNSTPRPHEFLDDEGRLMTRDEIWDDEVGEWKNLSDVYGDDDGEEHP